MSFDWSPPQNRPLHKINRLQALIFPSSGALGPVGLEQERAGVDGHGGGAAGGSLRRDSGIGGGQFQQLEQRLISLSYRCSFVITCWTEQLTHLQNLTLSASELTCANNSTVSLLPMLCVRGKSRDARN